MVLDRRGFIVDPKVRVARIREHAYRPGISAPKAGELLKRRSLAGETYFTSGNFAASTTEFPKLLYVAHWTTTF